MRHSLLFLVVIVLNSRTCQSYFHKTFNQSVSRKCSSQYLHSAAFGLPHVRRLGFIGYFLIKLYDFHQRHSSVDTLSDIHYAKFLKKLSVELYVPLDAAASRQNLRFKTAMHIQTTITFKYKLITLI